MKLTSHALLDRPCYGDEVGADLRRDPAPALLGEVQTDVAIVGGGLAGLSAAIELADRGFQVCVLEAREFGWGASGRNGGQVIHGFACEQATLAQQVGQDDARRLWAMSLQAIDLIHQRCARFGIDAGWQSGFVQVALSARKADALYQAIDELVKAYDYPMQWVPASEIREWVDSPSYHGGAYDPRSGHLNPLIYTLGLVRAAESLGVRLYEHSAVKRLTHTSGQHRLVTDRGAVCAKQVLLAANVDTHQLVLSLGAKILPVHSCMVATEPMPPDQLKALIPSMAAVCDTNVLLDYFRPTRDGRLVFGGRIKGATRSAEHLAQVLQQRVLRRFPQLASTRITHAWHGLIDVTLNRVPAFGRLRDAAGRPSSVYYLHGFSGHGLALTGMAGLVAAEAMAGDSRRFDVFERLRQPSLPGGAPVKNAALFLGLMWYGLLDVLG